MNLNIWGDFQIPISVPLRWLIFTRFFEKNLFFSQKKCSCTFLNSAPMSLFPFGFSGFFETFFFYRLGGLLFKSLVFTLSRKKILLYLSIHSAFRSLNYFWIIQHIQNQLNAGVLKKSCSWKFRKIRRKHLSQGLFL